MSKIFSASQIKIWDKSTIEAEAISSLDLMERAASKCVEWIGVKYPDSDTGFVVFCGHGNNGGDGLAIARLLLESGYRVKVYLNSKATRSNDNSKMLESLSNLYQQCIHDMNEEIIVNSSCILIDAIYGTGLNREIEGVEKLMIETFNHLPNTKISIDIPSGISADHEIIYGTAIKADFTLSFQSYKLSFLFPLTGKLCGDISVLPIRLNSEFETNEQTKNYLIDNSLIQTIYKKRELFSHKGTFGHSLLIVGSKGKMGAAILSAKSCLSAGSGLLTALIPEDENLIMQIAIPEVMTFGYTNTPIEINFSTYSSIGIGCGLGTSRNSLEILTSLLIQYQKPILLDADAINIISENQHLLQLIPSNSVLTPHPKEFDRLFGNCNSNEERKLKQIEASVQLKIFIVLKGRFTCISTPDGDCYYNPTGNPGMAKGGSGDSLSGIITGLFAQFQDMRKAVLLGVYVHGLAGDIAASKLSEEALLTSDLIDHIGEAFLKIKSNS